MLSQESIRNLPKNIRQRFSRAESQLEPYRKPAESHYHVSDERINHQTLYLQQNVEEMLNFFKKAWGIALWRNMALSTMWTSLYFAIVFTNASFVRIFIILLSANWLRFWSRRHPDTLRTDIDMNAQDIASTVATPSLVAPQGNVSWNDFFSRQIHLTPFQIDVLAELIRGFRRRYNQDWIMGIVFPSLFILSFLPFQWFFMKLSFGILWFIVVPILARMPRLREWSLRRSVEGLGGNMPQWTFPVQQSLQDDTKIEAKIQNSPRSLQKTSHEELIQKPNIARPGITAHVLKEE